MLDETRDDCIGNLNAVFIPIISNFSNTISLSLIKNTVFTFINPPKLFVKTPFITYVNSSGQIFTVFIK
jgi:hypothetical protein